MAIIPGKPQKPTVIEVNILIGICNPKLLAIRFKKNITNAPITSLVSADGIHFSDFALNNMNRIVITNTIVSSVFINLTPLPKYMFSEKKKNVQLNEHSLKLLIRI